MNFRHQNEQEPLGVVAVFDQLNIFTPDRRQSKSSYQSTNADKKSLETVFRLPFVAMENSVSNNFLSMFMDSILNVSNKLPVNHIHLTLDNI